MKKAVIFLILLFSIIPIVNAQGITIFGTEYSFVVLAPLVFIILSMLFFLGMYIKDNIGKWTKFKLPKFKFTPHKKKKVKEKAEKKKEISIDHLSRLNLLGAQLHKLSSNEAFQQYSKITKDFFKDSLEIPHEFTYSELKHIVKGHKTEIKLAEDISVIKYGGKELTKDTVRSLIKRLQPLVQKHTPEKEGAKPSLIERIKIKLTKTKEVKKEEVKPIKLLKVETEEGVTNLGYHIIKVKEFINKNTLFIKKRQIQNLVKRGERNLSRNINLSKRFYSEALLEYYRLPIKEEEDLANKLTSLHRRILGLKEREHRKRFIHMPKKFLKLKHKGEKVSKEYFEYLPDQLSKLKHKGEKVSKEYFEYLPNQLLKLKHEGKQISKEGIILVNRFKEFIEKGEKLTISKLHGIEKKLNKERFELAEKLKRDRRKLKREIKKDILKVEKTLKDDKRRFKVGVKRDVRKIEKLLKEKEQKLNDLLVIVKQRRLQKWLIKEGLREKEEHYKEIIKKPFKFVTPKPVAAPLPQLPEELETKPFKISGAKPSYKPKRRKRLTKTLKTLGDEMDDMHRKIDNLKMEELRRFKKQYYSKKVKKKPYVSRYQYLIEETEPTTSKETIKLREEADKIKRIIETS